MIVSLSCAVSLVLSRFIPEFILHEFSKVVLDLEHNVELLLSELEGSVKFLWVVWEGKSILEVNVVEPFLEVVLEESEG